MYCVRFTLSVKKKRRYLIYFAVSLLTQPYSNQQDIIIPEYKDKISNVVQKVNAVYREIKKNEIAPKTNYLFHNTAKADLDKTIAKLDMLNSMNTVIRSGTGGGDEP
jgi:NAD-specific glutamate dehydrogenase